MEVTRLRTMTYKSIIGFGKYAEMSISMLMPLQEGRQYLRWAYFHLEKINYIDDILKELRMEKYVIEKPGTSEEMFAKMKADFTAEFDEVHGRKSPKHTA